MACELPVYTSDTDLRPERGSNTCQNNGQITAPEISMFGEKWSKIYTKICTAGLGSEHRLFKRTHWPFLIVSEDVFIIYMR